MAASDGSGQLQVARPWDGVLRRPEGRDALDMHRLVVESKVLDENSTYAYLLMATEFADSSIVADRDGELHGFVMGYHPPSRPEALFVWQVVVAAAARGSGLGGTMLDTLVERVRRDRHGHPLTLEATVAPSNSASRALFGGFARRHGVPVVELPWYGAELLDADLAHEEEPLLRIGPVTAELNC
ncbi:diaminobutyrate acetyltransferase [Mycolicibacterium chitae]|nr:diaminobutyrate acetyltransferase [Mycolicibacterium chitae]